LATRARTQCVGFPSRRADVAGYNVINLL